MYALTTVETPVEPELEHVVSHPLAAAAEDLLDMLEYMRPAGSKSEKQFIKRYLVPLGATPDAFGNYWVVVGKSRVMWSSHTDTVHRWGGKQDVSYREGFVSIADASYSNCLGADCTTGVWLMRNMILAQVPGVYVFHRGEEVGAYGSKGVATKGDPRLDAVEFAIAFDRKGETSVITHQGGDRCASQAFVNSIVPMLPAGYRADDGGTFTDTANYLRMIPECTNLSVGYHSQHTKYEDQDLYFALRLLQSLKQFDETKLVAERDPKEYDRPAIEDFAWSWEDEVLYKSNKTAGQWARSSDNDTRDDGSYYSDDQPRSLYEAVVQYPEEIADLLEQTGYDVQSLMHDIGKGR